MLGRGMKRPSIPLAGLSDLGSGLSDFPLLRTTRHRIMVCSERTLTGPIPPGVKRP